MSLCALALPEVSSTNVPRNRDLTGGGGGQVNHERCLRGLITSFYYLTRQEHISVEQLLSFAWGCRITATRNQEVGALKPKAPRKKGPDGYSRRRKDAATELCLAAE